MLNAQSQAQTPVTMSKTYKGPAHKELYARRPGVLVEDPTNFRSKPRFSWVISGLVHREQPRLQLQLQPACGCRITVELDITS